MKNKKQLKRNLIIVIAAMSLAFIFAFVASSYALLNRLTLDMVMSYTDELASHDMNTIDTFVTDRWATLKSVSNKIKNEGFSTTDQVVSKLHKESSAFEEFDCLLVIDKNGTLYSDTGVVYNKDENPLLEYFELGRNYFVERYYGKGTSVEINREYMLYGYTFIDEPLTVKNNDNEDVEIVGIALLNGIDKIRSRLRITCFDNRGFAAIIIENGDYIVTAEEEEEEEEDTRRNFYEILSTRNIEKTNLDTIRKTIDDRSSVSGFWCSDEEGARRYITVYPIENYSGWNFVISLDESIFLEQTAPFVKLLVITLTVFLLIILAILFTVYKMSNNLKKMYDSVSDGVYNRQYYEDKIVDSYANAIAILDLDYLKTINDTFGHIAGDQAIKAVADAIVKFASKKASICRFGGDEFVIAFTSNLSSQEFEIILENIRKTASEAVFEEYPALKISMSIGGYYEGGIVKDILGNADALLYKAKESKNFVVTNIED